MSGSQASPNSSVSRSTGSPHEWVSAAPPAPAAPPLPVVAVGPSLLELPPNDPLLPPVVAALVLSVVPATVFVEFVETLLLPIVVAGPKFPLPSESEPAPWPPTLASLLVTSVPAPAPPKPSKPRPSPSSVL